MEDVRTVDETGRGDGREQPQSSSPSETEVASSGGRTSDSLDAKGVDKANSGSGLDAVLADTLGPQFHATSEAPRDMSAQGHDLVDLDQLLSAELVDPCWTEMAAVDVEQGGLPLLDLPEYPGLHDTSVPEDFLGKQPLQHDPMLFTFEQGDWDAPLGMGASHLPNDPDLLGYIQDYDQGTGSTSSHYTLSASPDLALRPKVSGWIENDRSLYFLHEIGIL